MYRQKLFKTAFAFLAAALLLLVSAISGACGKEGEKTKDGDNPNAGDNADPANQKGPDEPDLPPETDMGGKTFTALGYTGWGGDEIKEDIACEEQTGDPINDAAFERKIKIEQRYNCQIKVVNADDHNDAVDRIRTAVLAGDDSYDFAVTACANFATLLTGDFLTDFKNFLCIDMGKPYWDKNFYDSMSILGKNFAASGDISKRRLQCVWIMCFNKNMISANELESPYELVKNGDWTYGKMNEMAKKVAKDLNGDGKMTREEDLWGINYTGDTIMGIINCSGVKLAEINSSGMPELTVGSETNLEKLMRIYTDMRDNTYAIDTLFKSGGGVTGLNDTLIFSEGRCLFLACATHNIKSAEGQPSLREMEVDFGIIPYPKWDKAQESYMPHTAGNYHPAISVPRTSGDLENTGIILEAMAYEGMKTLVPAFYESLLKTKTARDDESSEMIDYIFGNLSYDIGNMYNFGGIGGIFGYEMSTNMRANIVSQIEKNSGVWEKAINDIIEAIENGN
ncbi:MAG: hypothetical protein FWG34_03010 [Oscillospiraceae bacterium]|nr:hypothetical protein [Oscillospiraceae bacterium]